MTTKTATLLQQAIDALLPIAAQARQQLGPNDDTVFRLGKALAALMAPKRRRRKTADGRPAERIKGRLPSGERVVLDVDKEMIE